jgi:hypothetical protein
MGRYPMRRAQFAFGRSFFVPLSSLLSILTQFPQDLHPSRRTLLTSIIALRGAKHVAKDFPRFLTPGSRILFIKYVLSIFSSREGQ